MLKNKLILFVFVIIAVFAGYHYLSKKDNPSGGNLEAQSGTSVDGAPPIGADLARKLAMLQNLKIDSSFFQDKSFASLTDFSVPIDNSLQTGRDNPFAPTDGSASYADSFSRKKSGK